MYLLLKIGVNRQPDAFWNLRADFGQDAQPRPCRRYQRQPSARPPGQDIVPTGFDAGLADDGLGIVANRFEFGDLGLAGIADMPNNVRHQRAAQIAAGGLLAEFGLAQFLHLLAVFDKNRRLHNAGINLPMRQRTGIEQVDNFVQRFIHRLRQNLKTGGAVRDGFIADKHPHHAAVLIGQSAAMAVINVGAAGNLRVEHQLRAIAHFSKNIGQRPGDAPLRRLRIHRQTQLPGIIDKRAERAGMKSHLILEDQR